MPFPPSPSLLVCSFSEIMYMSVPGGGDHSWGVGGGSGIATPTPAAPGANGPPVPASNAGSTLFFSFPKGLVAATGPPSGSSRVETVLSRKSSR
jgi:hypothetical protein